MPWRVSLRWLTLAAALCAALPGAVGCAGEPPPAFNPPASAAPPSSDGGVRAIDGARGLTAPELGRPGSNTGTWGGQQLPDIPAAPRL